MKHVTQSLLAVLLLLLVACSGAATDATPEPTAEVTDAPATAEVTEAPTTEEATAAPTATPTAEEATEAPTAAAVEGEILVFAAASLTDAFEQIATDLSESNPDATVTFNFGSSATLATQLVEGAPADVVATASGRTMMTVAEAGLLEEESQPFIANVLAIAVAPGNPLGITGLEDLADPEVTLVLAAPEVPAGQYAAEALANSGITVTPSSLEPDVRATLSRVELGEADAGIVYESDIVASDGMVEGIDIPAGQNVPATYPIATLAGAVNPEGADAFLDYVLSDEAETVLVEFGFTAAG